MSSDSSTQRSDSWIRAVVQLLRPFQWVKNGFVFLPIFFDRHFFQAEYWWPALTAFLAFSFAASAVYCFNDIRDAAFDRRHPVKKNRPIASGRVTSAAGYVLSAACLAASGVLLLFLPHAAVGKTSGVLLGYLGLNLAYCLWLKHHAIVDVFIIVSSVL